MSKKLAIIIAVVIIVIAAAVGVLIASKYSKNNDESSKSIVETIKEKIAPPVTSEEIYEDESGFSFKYYSDLKVTDVTPDDEMYYSQLEIKGANESLTLTIVDTTYTTADQIISVTPKYKGAKLSGAASLGGISAKQYEMGNSLVTLAIDQGVLYMVEAQKNTERSESIYDLIVTSFKIGKQSTTSGGSAPTEVIYEDEEVVE